MRPRTPPLLRLLRLANPAVRALLRSPAHRLLDRSLVLLTYTGPTSGRVFTIPLLYARHGDAVVTLASRPERKRWWRAFRQPTTATLTLRGRRTSVRGTLARDDEARAALRAYLARFPRTAGTVGATAGAPPEALDAALGAVALVTFREQP